MSKGFAGANVSPRLVATEKITGFFSDVANVPLAAEKHFDGCFSLIALPHIIDIRLGCYVYVPVWKKVSLSLVFSFFIVLVICMCRD